MISLFVAILLVALSLAGYLPNHQKAPPPPTARTPAVLTHSEPFETLDDLLVLPVEKLGGVDIAEMNLLCATGLPGAENLNISHALATLDQWAQRVAYETNRHLYRVTDPYYADHYHHSEAYLRAEMLVQVLVEDLGVKYDLASKDKFSFADSRVAFLHGMIPMPGQSLADTPGGTCASMPVLYVAVGRRLGYPLKLATTKGHVFVRWDGKDSPVPAWRQRFNIGGAGQGFSSFPDDYYKTWPFKLIDAEVESHRYIVSLAPAEEFAQFLAARGHCGMDNGQSTFAARCYENAYRYDQRRPAYAAWFTEAAASSGYRPTLPAAADLLHRYRSLARAEQIIAQQESAARREWLRRQTGGERWSANSWRRGMAGPPQPYVPQISGAPQPPSPYGPRLGASNRYQPYQPPIQGQPPR